MIRNLKRNQSTSNCTRHSRRLFFKNAPISSSTHLLIPWNFSHWALGTNNLAYFDSRNINGKCCTYCLWYFWSCMYSITIVTIDCTHDSTYDIKPLWANLSTILAFIILPCWSIGRLHRFCIRRWDWFFCLREENRVGEWRGVMRGNGRTRLKADWSTSW